MTLDKPFITIDEQIEKLEKRNLLFESKETGRTYLSRYGYYEIVNGYKDYFMLMSDNDDAGFKDGITFEHIYALFNLDKKLRSSVMDSLEIFESNLKQVLAYTISENISENQNVYIKRTQYNVGKKYWDKQFKKYMYPIDKLIWTLNNITRSKNNPYKHYREDHNNIPPWIIVKKLSFGNLIWWFKLLKKNEKDIVISRMLNLNIGLIDSTTNFSEIFGSLLPLYLNYRNTAAHGGRIYNHKSSDYELSYDEFLHKFIEVDRGGYRIGLGRSSFGVLLKSLKLFGNSDPYTELKTSASFFITNYLQLFPNDKDYLFKQMEISDKDIYKQKKDEK